ncbi:hypothetical protein TRIP_D300029 [uncultured Paludibacter sp.]|nr:hypothetical protein TRIP_D300029 [uncultured Paludibacter sp.]
MKQLILIIAILLTAVNVEAQYQSIKKITSEINEILIRAQGQKISPQTDFVTIAKNIFGTQQAIGDSVETNAFEFLENEKLKNENDFKYIVKDDFYGDYILKYNLTTEVTDSSICKNGGTYYQYYYIFDYENFENIQTFDYIKSNSNLSIVILNFNKGKNYYSNKYNLAIYNNGVCSINNTDDMLSSLLGFKSDYIQSLRFLVLKKDVKSLSTLLENLMKQMKKADQD